MNIYGKNIRQHINNLSCIFDKHCNTLTSQEKKSLNAAMQVMDVLERNNGVIILEKSKLS